MSMESIEMQGIKSRDDNDLMTSTLIRSPNLNKNMIVSI